MGRRGSIRFRFGLLVGFLLCSRVCVGSGTDLQKLNVDELRKMEDNLNERTAAMEVLLVQVMGQLNALSKNETGISEGIASATRKREEARAGRDQEENELRMVRNAVKAKKDEIKRKAVHIAEIRKEVMSLSERTADLFNRTAGAASKINEPSLGQVLDNKAEQWGEVPRTLYSKSQKVIAPAMSSLSLGANLYSQTVSPPQP